MTIEKEKVVTMNYTLKNDDGDIMDTSEGREPLAFIQGIGNLIAGLEKELEGKSVGDKVNAVINPEDAYGKRNPEMVQRVSKDNFQGEEEIEIGMEMHVESNQGEQVAVVVDVDEEGVTLDLNHPLADMTLHFDVEIVSVREATSEELDHGHVHGPGGHNH